MDVLPAYRNNTLPNQSYQPEFITSTTANSHSCRAQVQKEKEEVYVFNSNQKQLNEEW